MLADEQVLACDIAAQFCWELDVVISLEEKRQKNVQPFCNYMLLHLIIFLLINKKYQHQQVAIYLQFR
jgi:hypothetical protein